MYYNILYHKHATCHICTILLPPNALIFGEEEQKLTTEFSVSLCPFLPLTSNILLTTLLTKTLNLCSSLDVRNQISHPHK